MRRIIPIVLCIFIVVGLCACGSPYQYTEDDVELAWQDGFDRGYDSAGDDFDAIYEYAYEEGFSDGSRGKDIDFEFIFQTIYEEAEDYASIKTGWTVYEAWNNVMIYMDNPSEISKSDFMSSVETLAYFSMFMDEFDYNPRKYE